MSAGLWRGRRLRVVRATGAVGLGALLLAGCSATGAANVEVVTITPQGFEPASITVPAGTEVRFVNRVPARASVTSLEAQDPTDPGSVAEGAAFDSGPLGQGEVYALTLEEPGVHVYHSSFHTDGTWVGTISVEAP